MSFTISDLIVETLERAGVPPCLRASWRLVERLHRCTPPQRKLVVGARSARGGRRVRRRRRGGDHRRVGGVRGELRPGEPPPDQRALRCPSLAGAGAGDRGAHPEQRDRHDVLPGDASSGVVPRVQRLLRARLQPAQFPYVLDTAVRTALEKRGVAVLVVPGDVLVARTSPTEGHLGDPFDHSGGSSERRRAGGGGPGARRRERCRRSWPGRAAPAPTSNWSSSPARCRRRSCTRCEARSSSSTTTRSTSA